MRFDATVTIEVEADNEKDASNKISESLKLFESFSIEEGPDVIIEEDIEDEDE